MKRLLFVPLLLATACGKATHTTDEQAAAALDLITIEALTAHVEYLASDELGGRMTGEEGYDRAAAYVAEQFELMGVEAGGSDGWYQPVELRTYQVAGDDPAVTIVRDGEELALEYREEFSVRANPVLESASVTAEVVYVGYGIHAPEHGYSDFGDDIDIEGRIVAGFSGAPEVIDEAVRSHYASSRIKLAEAVSRGAIGTISLRTRSSEERYPWERFKDRIGKSKSMAWATEDGRASGHFPEILGMASLSQAAAEKLFDVSPISYEQALDAAEKGEPLSAALAATVSVSVNSEHSSITSPNVIGLIRGTDPELANEYIVYTAHLDHVGAHDDHGHEDEESGEIKDGINNGAYDNAIGVALMLETARSLVAAPPRRSVLFIALTAEERGLIGSDYFVNNPTVPVESIVANINLDMPLFLFPVADLVAYGSQHSSLHAVAEASAGEEGFVFSPDPIPEENLFVRSDQYSFVKGGIPAVYLTTGFNSTDESIDGEALFRDHLKNHYHRPSDDLTRPVDWDSALRFARAHTRMGFTIGTTAERPTWNEGNFYGETFGRR